MKTELEIQSRGDTVGIRIAGKVNEHADFRRVSREISAARSSVIEFDLGGVTDFNSTGVREWLFFLEQTQEKNSVRFLVVSEAVIEQAIVVPAMLGRPGTPVHRIQAPFYCPRCRVRSLALVETARMPVEASGMDALAMKCPGCGGMMQFDALSADYAAFLQRLRPRPAT